MVVGEARQEQSLMIPSDNLLWVGSLLMIYPRMEMMTKPDLVTGTRKQGKNVKANGYWQID